MIILFSLLAGATCALAASWIVPGAVWQDTNGKKIDAHGGMIINRGGTFHWVGHSVSNGVTPWMYSSTDLLNWQDLGAQAPGYTGTWRPKYAKPNGSFWLYAQKDRQCQVFRSSQLERGYKQAAITYLPPNDYSYSDTGMFLDPTSNTWFILSSADHNELQVNQILSTGYVGDKVSSLKDGPLEAPGIVYHEGVYYMIVSGKTGWRANPNKAYWSTSIKGPWAGGSDIAPPDQNTYGSQNTFELTIAGSQATTYVYMGDAWDSKGSEASNYIWVPFTIDNDSKKITLQYYPMWKVDPKTGVVSFPTTRKRYEAEHADLKLRSRAAIIGRCEDCASKQAVHRMHSGDEVTFYNVTGLGKLEYVTFHYTVTNREAGEAHIYVNDEVVPTNISDLNMRAGHHRSVPVPLKLQEGDVNTIRFGVTGYDDFEVMLDGIELHDD
uniref:Galactan-beta-galactosidase n=1 Tax=Moniliophthora roreri TaxID=221103 RepID=A0A0W0GF65_MONRR